jgi:hypothetical protein
LITKPDLARVKCTRIKKQIVEQTRDQIVRGVSAGTAKTGSRPRISTIVGPSMLGQFK